MLKWYLFCFFSEIVDLPILIHRNTQINVNIGIFKVDVSGHTFLIRMVLSGQIHIPPDFVTLFLLLVPHSNIFTVEDTCPGEASYQILLLNSGLFVLSATSEAFFSNLLGSNKNGPK